MLEFLFQILIFPGLLFLIIFGLVLEFIDRKLYARFQNRMGPPWYQPLADFIKLIAKEDIIPENADVRSFRVMPVFAFTAVVSAFIYIPVWGTDAVFSFKGDLIVVLYLLTIPTLCFFLGGWYSRSVYSMIGSVRTLTQFFAYEIPLLLAILASALFADTWSLSEMAAFYSRSPLYLLINSAGFIIALIALLGKLEKVPFDIPEAETEIVAGSFTEYTGRLYAVIRLTMDVEMAVGASLIAAVFMPFGLQYGPVIGFLLYLVKILLVIIFISISRSLLARFRIDQVITFCWKYVAPIAFLQMIISLFFKGILLR